MFLKRKLATCMEAFTRHVASPLQLARPGVAIYHHFTLMDRRAGHGYFCPTTNSARTQVKKNIIFTFADYINLKSVLENKLHLLDLLLITSLSHFLYLDLFLLYLRQNKTFFIDKIIRF